MQVYKDDDLIIERFEVGIYMVNTYIVGCLKTQEAAIVDPGDESDRILKRCEELDLTVKYILNTHGHVDHIQDNEHIKNRTNAQIVIHEKDAGMLTSPRSNISAFIGEPKTSPPADLMFQAGVTFNVGEVAFDILHIPGHSPGSICLIHDPVAIVGDVLFCGSIGRTDFPDGSYEQLTNGIREKLLPLGDHFIAFPGHGPETTLGQERRTNPFINDALF
ncbi:MBL fold metallo-hydrolase [candidate division LCP-89 bacterium B3_LCP]|uniref:MBL fold metallo-hydrolase n=1 Tax=candidate division LCP-89 bacterium B3_LCP TaxID=2012998 RepID=A0A532V3P3_UNCL8|nr:MAG: MBL fold metallo-hydrolase [candidate division LCP-89 bacterium B3_LCP]